MKTKILTLITFIITSLSFAQGGGFNYKALITDNGNVLATHSVTFKFTVLENGSTSVYQETQSATTDSNGIVTVNVGEGTLVSGNFTTIDWGNSPYFLKVEIDTGSGYQDFGTAEFKAVPYAKYADRVEIADNIQGIPVSSTTPANGQVLKYNGTQFVPADDDTSGGSGTDGVVNSAAFSGSSTKTLTLGRSNGLGNVTATFSDAVNDADHSTTNEIQHLSISSNQISLSNGGGTVTLPNQHDADFYKVGTTAPATSINDDIYTQGSLEIKSNSGSLLVLSSATNNSSIRPGIQFKNNTSQYIAGDDGSNEIFGFYSKWASHRTHDAKLRVYGKATGSGSWGKYVEITHDGTDATIKTDTGNILLEPNGNVGIGTNSPTSLLHISAGTTGDAVLTLEADTDNTGGEDDQPRIEMSQDGGLINAMIGFDNASNHLQIKTTHNFEFYNGDAGSQQKVASLDTGGNLNITGKLTTPATGSNDLKAFAYGTIDLFGTILSGTGNFNVDINAGVGIKKITLRDDNNNVINYDNNHFTTLVSIQTHPDDQDLHDMVYYITNNTLVIKTFVRNGPAINVTINFIIYKN